MRLIQVAAKYMETGPDGQWRVSRYVPPRLQAILQRKVLRLSLKTRDEAQALRLRDAALAQIQARLDRAETQLAQDPTTVHDAEALAKMLVIERQKVACLEQELASRKSSIEWGAAEIARRVPDHPVLAVPAATMPTFKEVMERFIDTRSKSGAWKNPTEAAQEWRDIPTRHAASIMDMPVDEITTRHIQALMDKHPPTKLRPRIEMVLQHAKAHGWRSGDNPAAAENLSINNGKKLVEHHAALPWQDVRSFVTQLQAKTDSVVAQALQLVILTACRSREVTDARWDEFDLTTATWTIPAERMKTGREHVVPLSDAAVVLLRDRKAAELPRHGGFVFPSATTKSGRYAGLGHASMDSLLKRMGVDDATVHGFRSSFRDWCADHGHDGQTAEFALGHVKKGVEGAYFRSTMVEKRRELMALWAKHCTSG
jgi:integrase